MVEKRKLAKNTSEKVQCVISNGKQIRVMSGEVIAADVVTNGKGFLYDGFEFFAEVPIYSPKPLQRKLNRGDIKVPFSGMKERVEKGMGKKDEKKCCPEKVLLLIENEATTYTEDDREWLESLTHEEP